MRRLVLLLAPQPPSTQACPSRPLKLIVPDGPGSVSDLRARMEPN